MYKLFAVLFLAFIFTSCKKSSDSFTTASLEEYYPLTVGKNITYRLDSLVYTNFGTTAEVHTYQVKYENDALVNDNLGRPGMRIIRYIRTTPAQGWAADATFFAVSTNNSIEFIENNLRYIKLKQPIREGFSWKGNAYIDTYSLNSDLKYLDSWDYTYDSVNVSTTVGTFLLDSTIKINHRDEIIGTPGNPNFYSEVNFGMEKYAKGIGMVYRRFFHSEYQPPTPGRGGYYQGYGVTYTMIEHN